MPPRRGGRAGDAVDWDREGVTKSSSSSHANPQPSKRPRTGARDDRMQVARGKPRVGEARLDVWREQLHMAADVIHQALGEHAYLAIRGDLDNSAGDVVGRGIDGQGVNHRIYSMADGSGGENKKSPRGSRSKPLRDGVRLAG